MKVVHLNTSDLIGGAARAAYRLHMGLCSLGHDSSMLVVKKNSSDPTVAIFKPERNLYNLLRRYVLKKRIDQSFAKYKTSGPADWEPFSVDRSQYGGTLLQQLAVCDVINLHWIANFVDYNSFFSKVPKKIPIVWTLHDMNAFTGGCHYNQCCKKYYESCGACKQLGSKNTLDLSRQVWLRKWKVFQEIDHRRLHIVTPSQWLAKEAKRSSLFKRYPVSVIPYSLDTEVFSVRERSISRSALDIPLNAKVVLFVAAGTNNKRKGFAYLAKALIALSHLPELFLVLVGNAEPQISDNIAHLHLGRIDNDRILSLVYSAADLFVIPSIQDNLPLTVLESMACGTPIIGFNVGGIPDIVKENITGLLVPEGDTFALGKAIGKLLGNKDRLSEMSANCRRVAIEEYSIDVQAHRYEKIYKRMLVLGHFNK
jgi:glycosyltransferase involved in cell wall biosynthesis